MKDRNKRNRRIVLTIVFLIGLCLIFGNEAAAVKPKLSCNDLSDFTYPNTVITSATLVLDGEVSVAGIGPMPEHCVVTGRMNERVGTLDGKTYAIGFEMRLPTQWKKRFLYQANGGIDGSVVPAYGNDLGGGPTSNGLLKGFAVISSDAGHSGEMGPFFGIDPQARIDYGYNAVAQLTPMAKSLITTYYKKQKFKSYLYGCSNGGRHAMVAASRYADQYDGILAGNPGFNLPKAAVAQLWGAQQFYTITTPDTNIGSSFTPTELALVGDAILAKCDNLDGLEDDMVTDPIACQGVFDLALDVPTCTGDRDGTCLTADQKDVLAAIHEGAKNTTGPLYTNFPWDVGIKGSNWSFWKFTASTLLDPGAVGFIFSTPPENPLTFNSLSYALNLCGTGFDPDIDAPKIFTTDATYSESGMSFMTPPDLAMTGLFEHKSKLLVVHGTSDGVFSVSDTINWYESFLNTWGRQANKRARLFLVPQMNHCSGGPACDQFNMLDTLVKWVEKGQAPKSIVATARGTGANVVNAEVPASWAPNRTRLLCPYPAVAKYRGRGSIEDAKRFKCVIPKTEPKI
ncbi:MAG: tannase/feruloyl esterase family alpha/beta hydrolase [Syntrophorhabdus sp.]|nr:tannase/feruloyl esterase family alpha/beta hydrolase [Syntrophorhabdus sp.]